MADLQRIKNNVSKMVAQGAPESDIDSYLAGEGTTPDALRSLSSAPSPAAAPPAPGEPAEPGPNDPNIAAASAYASRTAQNVPSSAYNVVADVAHAVAHPIETGENLAALGSGVLAKFGIGSGDEKVADAVGQYFKERYGGMDNISKSFEKDPVGVLLDLSTVLTGGGTALAKLPGAAGKVGELAGAAGRIVDPMLVPGGAAKLAAKGAAEGVGMLTGVGGKSLKLAGEAGTEALGSKGRDFLSAITGATEANAPVKDAMAAVNKLREDRGTAYRSGMVPIANDKTVLNFSKIDNAIQGVSGTKNYKGQDLSPTTAKIRAEMQTAVSDWKQLPAADFHTAEGLDALKQKLGDIRDGTQHGTPERRVSDAIYNSVKNTIVDQAPEYAKVMKGYEEASKELREIESTLSLKPNANIDTSLRKLQSVLRNNVNSNYGRRGELADYLVAAGAKNLLTKLAGQSLSTWTPRGLGAVVSGEANIDLPGLAKLAVLPLSSPKIAGMGAFGLGAASATVKPTVRAGFQGGTLDRLSR